MTVTTLLIVSIVVVASLTAVATAVRSVSRIWLRHWVERRLSGALTAELYLERPQQLILAATTAVAMTVCLAGISIGTEMTGFMLRARTLLLYAIALLLFGQLIPRAVARRWPSAIIPPLLPVLRLIEFVLMPVLIVVRRLTGEAAKEAREDQRGDADTLGELLREGELEGVGEHTEIAIIEGVVHFGEKMVGEVMTGRDDIFAAEVSLAPRDLARGIAQGGYSRVPIYRESLDHIEGFVHAFDVLQALEGEPLPLRPVGLAAPSMTCNDLLFRMLRERKHLTIVQGNGGRTLGVVTLEDLLEELVGEIRDEHDEPTPGPRRPGAGHG
ncbi:MAG: CNNM domain-containing protein [Gemmatimonadaceae bacterium]